MNPETPFAAPERFAVSHLGMQEIHADRPPWQLVKELIQNVFDEAPPATVCQVTITNPPEEPTATRIIVADDGPGFADIKDCWTLLKPTPKRQDPTKRGRFNLGEKELISVALEAVVETAGWTVEFPRIGSRAVSANRRRNGTAINALMPWGPEQKEQLIARLLRFRPTDCRLIVNGYEVTQRQPLRIQSAILPTVLQDSPGQPMRHTRRRTELHLLTPSDPDAAWLYEMGIPIQPIDCQWDIDVQQKIPMPPNRDTVSSAYLQDIYAEALNAALDLMAPADFGAVWIDTAIEDQRTSDQAVRDIVHNRYGAKPAFSGPDRDANMKAAESGHSLIHPNSLSPTERERFKAAAAVPTAHQLYGITQTFNIDDPEILISDRQRPELPAFRHWANAIAAYCGITPEIICFEYPHTRTAACCAANTKRPLLGFNAANLPTDFFSPPYNRPEQLEVLVHELAHALADKPMEHGPSWGDAACAAAAKITDGLLKDQENKIKETKAKEGADK